LLHNQTFFLKFFERASSQVNTNLLNSFLPFCLEQIEHMAEIGRRKVVAMALLSIMHFPFVTDVGGAETFLANLLIAVSSVVVVPLWHIRCPFVRLILYQLPLGRGSWTWPRMGGSA
jgi:hypothetical protein